jgi:hypothetical protein
MDNATIAALIEGTATIRRGRRPGLRRRHLLERARQPATVVTPQ